MAIRRGSKASGSTSTTPTAASGGSDEIFDKHLDDLAAAREDAPVDTAPPKYSTSLPSDHALLSQWMQQATGIPAGVASDLANMVAGDWANTHQGSFPSIAEILENPMSINSALWASSGLYQFPTHFGVRDGQGKVSWYSNSPKGGLVALTNPLSVFRLMETSGREFPVFDQAQFEALLNMGNLGPRRSGGGGRGGAGRQAPVFDRDQLAEGARQIWRGLLLDEPDNVEALVDDYVNSFTSFFNQGGQLDFETFVLNKARDTGRYQMLYRRKPEGVGEGQWLSQYVQSVAAVGLAGQKQITAVEQAANAGIAPDAVTGQLAQRADVQAANQGGFSQRFAAHFAQLGLRGT